MSALYKVGKIPQPGEQSKIKVFDKNKDLPFDFVSSNMLDRYSYVKSCPTRYTDPSGHNEECPRAILEGGLMLIVMAPIDLVLGVASLAAIAEPTPFGEAVMLLPDTAALYLTILSVQKMGQGLNRSCEDVHIDPNILNNSPYAVLSKLGI
jgi:hypothetical protein